MRRSSTSDTKEPYTNWLASSEIKEKLKLAIQRVGYPLEVSTRNIFEKCGFSEYAGRYYLDNLDGQEIWREIDLRCETPVDWFNLHECEISFNMDAVVECKYSSTNDYFIFEAGEELHPWAFPLLFESENFFPYNGKTFQDYFKFPSQIHNIAEVDVNNLVFHSSDRTVFEAANQLSNALAYFAKETSLIDAEIIADIEKTDRIITKFNELVARKNLAKIPASDKDKKLQLRREVAQELLPFIDTYQVHCWMPILVIGKNNGLLKVSMSQDHVTDFTDVGYSIYKFRPSKVHPYLKQRRILKNEFPFIICNEGYLERCLSVLDAGMKQAVLHAKTALENDPFLVLQDAIKRYTRYQEFRSVTK